MADWCRIALQAVISRSICLAGNALHYQGYQSISIFSCQRSSLNYVLIIPSIYWNVNGNKKPLIFIRGLHKAYKPHLNPRWRKKVVHLSNIYSYYFSYHYYLGSWSKNPLDLPKQFFISWIWCKII